MSWIMKLYQTYENCSSEIGRITYKEDDTERAPLLPIAHTTMNAQIELTLNARGECIGGRVLDKKAGVTVIPCTEESASRSGKMPIHHPLFDKLQYLAGDYHRYGGTKSEEFYQKYMDDLELWCNSTYVNLKVQIICDYLKKKRLIEDLILLKIFVCNENGILLEKWNGAKEDMPDIFKQISGAQLDVAVRIDVKLRGDTSPQLWKDPQVYQDYINYYLSSRQEKRLCYGSGEWVSCSDLHSKKIVPFEANAKLVSANDTQGFTYRGRFEESGQVAALSYEVSQKAHNVLRWMIEKQGYTVDKQCFLAWGTRDELLPPLTGDSVDIVKIFERREQEEAKDTTNQSFAKRFNQALAGYGAQLDTKAQVAIIGLLAATPGRLSITFYREMPGDQFMERVKRWHDVCKWYHTYGVEEKQRFSFEGAPSPKDIVFAGYGTNCSDKLKRSLIERILSCIVDGGKLPVDIMRCAVNRASNPIAMKEPWERDKTLSIACALYRKHYFDENNEEELPMSLDKNRNDRSYLYGRLLAVAHYMEQRALDKWNERDTNAMRYQNTFSKRPYQTWKVIRENLRPYESKLLSKSPPTLRVCQNLFGEINDLFEPYAFDKEVSLEPLYLHGFDCQMRELTNWKKDENAKGKDVKDGDAKDGDMKGEDTPD